MYTSLIFWFSLSLPGYVAVRYLFQEDLKSGFLGTLGMSYVAVFGILSPVSILCYWFEASISVFSATCVVVIVAGIFEISRRGWWRDIAQQLIGAIGLGFAVLLADMVMAALTGAQTGGDAPVHLARIRCLLDNGFNNLDPFVTGDHFFPIYHTNILHALHATCAKLTGVDYIRVWFVSLVFAKLLIASGTYYVVSTVFRRKSAAWVAVVFMIGCQGPINFTIYPNKIAPFWLIPMMIGFTVQLLDKSHTGRSWIKIAAGSLLLGQIHSLYGAFAGILLCPVLVLVGLTRVLRRHQGGWKPLAGSCGLLCTLPFLMISKANTIPTTPTTTVGLRSTSDSSSNDVTTRNSSRHFRRFDNGWIMLKPRNGWQIPTNFRTSLLFSGLLIASATTMSGNRKPAVGVFLGIMSTAMLVLYAPPICTGLLSLFQREWILARMGFIFFLGFALFVPASIALIVEWMNSRWLSCSKIGLQATSALLILSAVVLGAVYADKKPPYDWHTYLEQVKLSRADRHTFLTVGDQVTKFCRAHIPTGSTVLLDGCAAIKLVSIHNCHIVAPHIGSNGVPDLQQRRNDLRLMTAPDTPWQKRRTLLRKYDIEYFFPARSSTDWTTGHLITAQRFSPTSGLFRLNTQ